jgi:hypothetical protein
MGVVAFVRYSKFFWMLCVLCVLGCTKTIRYANNPVAFPLLDSLPKITREHRLLVSGNKQKNSAVFIQYENESEAKLWVPENQETFFQSQLSLHEGVNTFVLSSVYQGVRGSVSQRFQIILDTAAPAAPKVIDFKDTVVVFNSSSQKIILQVQKEKGAFLLKDGQEVPSCTSVELCFLNNISILKGENRISLAVRDLAGNMSAVENTVIYGVDEATALVSVPPFCWDPLGVNCHTKEISLDTYISSHNDGSYALNVQLLAEEGEENSWDVFYVRLSYMLQRIPLTGPVDGAVKMTKNASGAWVYDLRFNEGHHYFAVYAQRNDVSSPIRSSAVRRDYIIDTVHPESPQVSLIGNTSIVVNGVVSVVVSVSQDAYPCLRQNQQTHQDSLCFDNEYGSTKKRDVSLTYGENDVCFYASDAAGNSSGERCLKVYRLSPPMIEMKHPKHGSSVSLSLVDDVQVNVHPVGSDQNHVNPDVVEKSSISSVQVEVDGYRCGTVEKIDEFYNAKECLTHVQNEASVHLIYVQAVNKAGLVQISNTSFVLFSDDKKILSTTGVAENSLEPSLFVDSEGYSHVVWSDNCASRGSGSSPPLCAYSQNLNTSPDVLYRKFSALEVGPIVLISTGGVADGMSRSPDIAMDAQKKAHVVWVEGRYPRYTLAYRYVINTENGNPVLGDIKNIISASNIKKPSIALDTDGTVFLVWSQGESVYVVRKSKNNDVFESPVKVSGDSKAEEPFLVVSNKHENLIYVVWEKKIENNISNPSDIEIASALFGAAGSPPAVRVVQVTSDVLDGNGVSERPCAVEMWDGRVSVFWQDDTHAGSSPSSSDYALDIMRRSFGWNGDILSASTSIELVSTSNGSKKAMGVFAFSDAHKDHMVVAWEQVESENPLEKKIFYIRNSYSQMLLSTASQLESPMSVSEGVQVSLDTSENMVFVWQDNVQGPLGFDETDAEDTDIFYTLVPAYDH